jgi:hypothetical protein
MILLWATRNTAFNGDEFTQFFQQQRNRPDEVTRAIRDVLSRACDGLTRRVCTDR